MPSDAQTAPASKKRIWAGPILSGLPVLFLLFDAIIKLIKIRPVVELHVLFPTYVAAMIWGGPFLREDRLRALLPLRSPTGDLRGIPHEDKTAQQARPRSAIRLAKVQRVCPKGDGAEAWTVLLNWRRGHGVGNRVGEGSSGIHDLSSHWRAPVGAWQRSCGGI